MSESLAIIVLTYNEADNLPRCLDSIAGFGEIIVLDSGSDDGTLQIAQSAGVRVYERPFESFAQQRNWALENCDLKTEWVLFLDADEVATPEFRQAVGDAIHFQNGNCESCGGAAPTSSTAAMVRKRDGLTANSVMSASPTCTTR